MPSLSSASRSRSCFAMSPVQADGGWAVYVARFVSGMSPDWRRVGWTADSLALAEKALCYNVVLGSQVGGSSCALVGGAS